MLRAANGSLARVTVLVTLLCLTAGCTKNALVTETFSPEFYEIPKQIPEGDYVKNPRFMVIGDSRPGWRAEELGKKGLFTKRGLLRWRQLFFPFYQIYLIGNGVVGIVNRLRFAPDYGDAHARRVRDDVYAKAKRVEADFIVHLGDIATDGRRAVLWRNFIKQYKHEVPVVHEYPIVPVIGNHERANDTTYGFPNYEAVFSYPRFYRISCPDVDLIVLDSDYIVDQDGLIDDDTQDRLFEEWFVAANGGEPAWLERELAASDANFKMVFMHHPPVSFGKHHTNWIGTKNGRNLAEKRGRLLRLLQKHNVSVVLAGHQHMYEHSVMAGNADGSNMHVVVTGGAGSPLHVAFDDETKTQYSENYRREGFDVECVRQEPIYNYCVVNTSGERLSIEAFEVTKKRDGMGPLIERVVIERN
jgi:3',5'-cyclic AMP phosphodiesterase CpdA